MRLFIAFPIPEHVRAYARELQNHLRDHGVKGKWVNPDNLHLTVLFLGDQSDDVVTPVADQLDQVATNFSPLVLQPAAPATFGNPPRVLFLSLQASASPTFAAIAKATQRSVVHAGLELDPKAQRREPVAHLTLVRFRHRREARHLRSVGRIENGRFTLRSPFPAPSFDSFTASQLRLYQSTLSPEGPHYTVLHESILTAS